MAWCARKAGEQVPHAAWCTMPLSASACCGTAEFARGAVSWISYGPIQSPYLNMLLLKDFSLKKPGGLLSFLGSR